MTKSSAITEWLDNPKRLITVAIIIVVLGVALYFGIKYIKRSINQIQREQRRRELIDEQSESASYSKAQFKEWADQLYTAMKGLGTDEDTIDRIMGYMKNDTDVLTLVDAFGTRDGEDLYEWIAGEYIGEPSCNEVLRRNGITITFAS